LLNSAVANKSLALILTVNRYQQLVDKKILLSFIYVIIIFICGHVLLSICKALDNSFSNKKTWIVVYCFVKKREDSYTPRKAVAHISRFPSE
jgi:hypothetical protein